MPKRIQRKRSKGWRAPEGAIYVGRGSMWGNPFTIKELMNQFPGLSQSEAQARAVDTFKEWLDVPFVKKERRNRILNQIRKLRGKDLMCWCKDGEACHADVLLEMANK